jgi:arsenate reductase (glutaredoxin)
MSLTESDDQVLLLHNPRCSKSRQVKALLEERGVLFIERRYIDKPLDDAELQDLARRLGRPVREWTRTKEAAFEQAGLDDEVEESAWFEALAAAPILLERPIVVHGDSARVGRPPEDVLEIL